MSRGSLSSWAQKTRPSSVPPRTSLKARTFCLSSGSVKMMTRVTETLPLSSLRKWSPKQRLQGGMMKRLRLRCLRTRMDRRGRRRWPRRSRYRLHFNIEKWILKKRELMMNNILASYIEVLAKLFNTALSRKSWTLSAPLCAFWAPIL
jgi:hypothetical protein